MMGCYLENPQIFGSIAAVKKPDPIDSCTFVGTSYNFLLLFDVL